MVMLSQPSPVAVEGARHLSSTLSHTEERLLSCVHRKKKPQEGGTLREHPEEFGGPIGGGALLP